MTQVRLEPLIDDKVQRRRRAFGAFAGKISVPDSFFDPLPEAELKWWEGRSDE